MQGIYGIWKRRYISSQAKATLENARRELVLKQRSGKLEPARRYYGETNAHALAAANFATIGCITGVSSYIL